MDVHAFRNGVSHLFDNQDPERPCAQQFLALVTVLHNLPSIAPFPEEFNSNELFIQGVH